MNIFFLGDEGTILRCALTSSDGTPFPLQSATSIILILVKPSGAADFHAMALTTDGSDGLAQYVTQPGDIDQAGHWLMQAHADTPSWSGYFGSGEFYVRDPLAPVL